MAYNAATVWEIRTTGSNNNGGGWYDAGGASVDYSQQNAAELSVGDVIADGSTTLTSVTGGFTDAMVGSIINVLTKGRYQITVRTDTNTITVDANVAADTGLTGNVGGAVADLEEIDSILVNGNDVHVGAGTYNAGGAISIASSATTAIIRIIGYNATRGDEPAGDDRPLFAMGANGFDYNGFNRIINLRGTTSHANGFECTSGAQARNCKMISTAVGGSAAFLDIGGYTTYFDCEADASTGDGFRSTGVGTTYYYCWAHGGGQSGFKFGSSLGLAVECISNGMDTGFDVGNQYGRVVGCTADGNTLGINVGTFVYVDVVNCQITNNTTGLSAANATYDLVNFYDYNNWNGNGTDTVNHTKGEHATADAPGYADQPSEDFSEVDDANAFAIRLGVT